MGDIAIRRGKSINLEAMQTEFGVDVLQVNGRSGEGIDKVKDWISNPHESAQRPIFDVTELASRELGSTIETDLGHPLYMELHREFVSGKVDSTTSESIQVKDTTMRYGKIGSILKKVEEKPKRTASAGIRRIIEEYNLDVSQLNRNTLRQIQQQYDKDLRALGQKYAQGIQDLINRM